MFSAAASKVFLALLVVALLVYGQTLFYPFVHDDFVFIVENPQIGRLDDLGRIFLGQGQAFGAADGIRNVYYRPLLELLTKIQHSIFGAYPFGYHLFNILLHALNSFLVYWVARLLTPDRRLSFLTAVFFLIHPIQTESVAAIAGISNLAGALLCLGSVMYYVHADRVTGRKRVRYQILSVVSFLLALLTKENTLALVPVLIIYRLLWTRGDGRAQKIFLSLGGHLGAALAYLGWRKLILGQVAPHFWQYWQELLLRLAAIPETFLMYLRLLIFPIDLHYYRCVDILKEAPLSLGVLVAVIVAVILIARYVLEENRRIGLFALFWFLGFLLPHLNIIALVNEYSLILTAEHFLYLPSIGFFLFVFLVLKKAADHLKDRYSRDALFAALLVLAVVCAALTVRQNFYWRGEVPLFKRTLNYEKDFARAHVLLGRAYYFEKAYDAAIKEYLVALSLMEGYAQKTQGTPAQDFYRGFIKEIHFDLAHCYEGKGDDGQAVDIYKKALEIDPRDQSILNNIGAAFFRLGKIENATMSFKTALDIDPRNTTTLRNLVTCFMAKGDEERAQKYRAQLEEIEEGN